MQTQDFISVEHGGQLARDYLSVNWCITTICNFNCTYCPEKLHDGKVKGPDLETVIRAINRIKEHYKDKKIFFEFTGGEVTYLKHFLDIAKHIKSLDCDLGIISNGKQKLQVWEKLSPLLDHICLSYHPENYYQDHFVEVVRYLRKR